MQITWDENAGSFTWLNRAGVSWSLSAIPMGDDAWSTENLAVGPDCPYFNSGHTFAGLEWQGEPGASELSTISGPHSELYQREACPCRPRDDTTWQMDGNEDCCSNGIEGFCGEGEGDCDRDSECAGSLVCGRNNCPWGPGDGDDCCTGMSKNIKDRLRDPAL